MFTCYYKPLPKILLLCVIILLLCCVSIFDSPQGMSDTHDHRGYSSRVHQRVYIWKVKITSLSKDQHYFLNPRTAMDMESRGLSIKSSIRLQRVLYSEIKNIHIKSLLKSIAYKGDFWAFKHQSKIYIPST